MEKLEQLIEELYGLESQIKALEEEKEQRRQLIQKEMLKANVGQFKNELGTISLTDRKTIKYKKDKSEIAQHLINLGLDNFVETIPEKIELNKDFETAVKSEFGIKGIDDYVDVQSNIGIITRFNK